MPPTPPPISMPNVGIELASSLRTVCPYSELNLWVSESSLPTVATFQLDTFWRLPWVAPPTRCQSWHRDGEPPILLAGNLGRARFHTPNNARNVPRTLRTKFRKIQKSRSRNFGDFGNSRFFLSFPCSAAKTSSM